jgi:Zn-dependent protease with chaperone function
MIAGAYAFNVLVSAAITFAAASCVLLLARLRFFARRPRLALALCALPFAKLAIELARGVPRGAFFWAERAGAVQELGSFQIGIGVDRFGPLLRFFFGAQHRGVWSPQSAADGLARILDRAAGRPVSAWVGALLASIGLALAAREIVRLGRASRACRRHAAAGTVVATRRLGLRRVTVIVSPSWPGAPFAGGLVRPWICASAALWEALSPAEREAVVAHELAHLRWLDGALLVAARLGRALLWFAPGAGAALRALCTQCEIAADDDALRRGAEPGALASALVRSAEIAARGPTPLLPFFRRGRSPLARRVEALLRDERPPALGRLAVALVVLIGSTVLRMTAFGNP